MKEVAPLPDAPGTLATARKTYENTSKRIGEYEQEDAVLSLILVTGCAGFIGSKVVDLLLDQGHEVIGIDNLNDAYDPRIIVKRLAEIRDKSGFVFCELDIGHVDFDGQLENSVDPSRLGEIEAVVNLAARAGVRQSVTDPRPYYETNVMGTLNLLEVCRDLGIGKFVLASTSSLYGERGRAGAGGLEIDPFGEDLPSDRPMSPYSASKKAAETLAYAYHQVHGIDVTVPRYFTVYGPAGRPDMSIFRFVKWIREGQPLLLYGDGSQLRDFTYVEDVARGTVLSLKPMGYEIINLGSDRPVAINEVIAKIEDLLDRNADIHSEPPHPADVSATRANIDKARRLLGWEPTTSIEPGLEHTVNWYLENRSWAKDLNVGDAVLE